MTVKDTVGRVRSGADSALQTVRRTLDTIEQRDGTLRAFLSIDAQRALQRAGAVDQTLAGGDDPGPLAGVPIAVKDNICTAFGTTTCASRMLDGFRAPYSAHVVERLEAAGAIVIGKTNLDEFGMGSSTEHSARQTTSNPWDPTRVAGGSSGGSAAAVAAGLVPAALGSDTGGSVRQPAAFCGVVGLKPTYGRVSRLGLVAYASSLDQIGPLTTTAEDAALLTAVIAGHDPRDSTCVNRPLPDYLASLTRPLSGLRIGVAEEYFGPGLDDQIAASIHEAIDVLGQQGAETAPVRLPHTPYAVACYYLVATAEASSNLARFDGVRYGQRAAAPANFIDLYCTSRSQGFGAEVKRRIMLGTYALSSGYYDAYYLKALKVRTLIRRDFDAAFADVDVIISPTTPTTAFAIGEKTDDPLAMYLADVYTISASLAGLPAISVPGGFDDRGMPIGVQLVAPPFEEARLLNIAHVFQTRTDYHRRQPPTE